MTSSRLPPDLSLNATTRTLDAIRRRGIDVIDLTVSNPTKVGLDYPGDLLDGLGAPAALVYEPQPRGLPAARAAVAADFARRGRDVPPDRVVLTASTSEAYAWLFKLLCDAGDSVLVPRPSYPLFEHLTVLESVEARPYRLEYHGTWRIDLESVVAAIDDRTRALLVVSPNNPTGSFLHRDDLVALAEVCAARELMLIGDEVFSDYAFVPVPHAASVLDAADVVTCSLGGLSKSAGLPQVKLGWIAFGGPDDALAPVLDRMDIIADTYLSVSTPVQQALPALIERGALVRAQIQSRIARNLEALRRAVAGTPSVSLLDVEGGWSAVVQVPAYRSEESLVLELLTADHILVHPGFFFDFEREAFLVVSLLVPPADFDRGVAVTIGRAAKTSVAS
jgi:aspartate/methionine/tyrosine aminotransferase